MASVSPLVIIPARMASKRLPGKPLAMIAGQPMIVHVWRRATEAGIGPVVVAAGDREIAAAIWSVGGQAVLTSPHHLSGSDRVLEAAEQVDPEHKHDVIVNFQGDMPTFAPKLLHKVVEVLRDSSADIATLASPILSELPETADLLSDSTKHPAAVLAKRDPNWVKAVVEISSKGNKQHGRALYFTRVRAPWGDGVLYHHIGVYAYRRNALVRFVGLAPSALERREQLEQLRALANGMHIQVALVDEDPVGVDTHCDLERARALLGSGAA